MTLRLPVAAALLLGASTTAALAEFTYSGIVTVGQYDFEGSTIGAIDLGFMEGTAEYQFGGGPFGVGLDAEVVVLFDQRDNALSYFNLYAIYETSFGRFELGQTGSALDLIRVEDSIGRNRYASLIEDISFSGNLLYSAYLNDQTIYGLTYHGDYGATQVSASYHRLDDSELDIYGAAIRSQVMDRFYVSGGIEFVDSSRSNLDPNIFIGGGYAHNGLRVDAVYSRLGLLANSTRTDLSVEYDIQQIDGLSLGGVYHVLEFPNGRTLEDHGLGVRYVHGSGLGIDASVMSGDRYGELYAVELSYRF